MMPIIRISSSETVSGIPSTSHCCSASESKRCFIRSSVMEKCADGKRIFAFTGSVASPSRRERKSA